MYSPVLYYEIAKIYIMERIDDAHNHQLIRAMKDQEHPSRDDLLSSLRCLGEILEILGRNSRGLQTKDGGELGSRGTSYG
jgi:hypothetical protein